VFGKRGGKEVVDRWTSCRVKGDGALMGGSDGWEDQCAGGTQERGSSLQLGALGYVGDHPVAYAMTPCPPWGMHRGLLNGNGGWDADGM